MTAEPLTVRRAALACAIAALCLPVAARLVAGPPGAVVHVRWNESVDAPIRQNLEARFRLEDGERVEGLTWRYDLVDPSPDTIRDLVRDPAVGDTNGIDRARFVPDRAERTARRGRMAYGGTLVTAADALAITLAAVAALAAFAVLSQTGGARSLRAGVRDRAFAAEHRLPPYVLLAILALAIYGGALRFPPTDEDDVAYLSSVAATGNPLSYFVGDHGHGNGLYRPLTPASIWLVYQGFGVWALPNQIINLFLHLANAFLLYRIIRREQPDQVIALLLAAVFLISQYTFLAATWTSDRPMVLTGLFLLLLVNHLSRYDGRAGTASAGCVRVSAVACLSVLALMSKESGLVVPAVGFLFGLMARRLTSRHRLSVIAVTASIMGLYIVFRQVIFGSDFSSYSQDGYMFLGAVHYEDSDELPLLLRYLNYAENVVKHALAPLLPVFAEGGALLTGEALVAASPVIVGTAMLFGLAVSPRPSRLQWIAVMVIVANAAVHCLLFRIRLHYLSHAALCLFVAGSPLLGASPGHAGRKLAVKTLAIIVLVGGIVRTSTALDEQLLSRRRALTELQAEGARHTHVWDQVLRRYR